MHELTVVQEKRYAELLEIARSSYEKLGEALGEIRDKRLYREHYPTWEAFIKGEFGKSRAWGYLQIATTKAVKALPEGVPMPRSARAARKLLPKRPKVIEVEATTLPANGEMPVVKKRTANEAFWAQARKLAGDIHAAVQDRRLGLLRHHVQDLSQLLLVES
jgi:hypothetical protein